LDKIGELSGLDQTLTIVLAALHIKGNAASSLDRRSSGDRLTSDYFFIRYQRSIARFDPMSGIERLVRVCGAPGKTSP
jgi:hypothetical protein